MASIGRNQPCPCGSNKKFKKCCGQTSRPDPSPALDITGFVDEGVKRITGISYYLVQNLRAVADVRPDEYDDCDFESMFKKSCFALCTVAGLRTPHNLENQAKIYDFSSANALVRVMYESSIAMRYIWCEPDADRRRLLHSVWRIRGHRERAKAFLAPTRADNQKTYAEAYPEKVQVNEGMLKKFVAKMEKTQTFASFEPQRQRNARQGHWRRLEQPNQKRDIPWSLMAERVSLSKFFGQSGYSHGSSYVHSDAVSVFQIHDAFHPEQQLEMLYAALMKALCYQAHAMESYYSRYPKIRLEASHDRAFTIFKIWLDALNSQV